MRRSSELAWAAGIIDGEGCIMVKWGKPSCYTLILRVAMIDKPTVDRLHQILATGRRSIETKPEGRKVYSWYANSREAETALLAVLPYLYTKRHEAEMGLAFQALKKETPRFQELPEPERLLRHAFYLGLRAAKP